jgi:hypothetical protein
VLTQLSVRESPPCAGRPGHRCRYHTIKLPQRIESDNDNTGELPADRVIQSLSQYVVEEQSIQRNLCKSASSALPTQRERDLASNNMAPLPTSIPIATYATVILCLYDRYPPTVGSP